MRVGFDISQTGSDKAGCGYFSYALAQGLSTLDGHNSYTFYPTFGDFYFDPLMPIDNPYKDRGIHYGPRQLTREGAGDFWRSARLEESLGHPQVVHSNNFWCPATLVDARLIYTVYDLGFAIEPAWTTETNRVGCFDGVFQSAISADWILAISEASKANYLELFPHFPSERVRVIYPSSRFEDTSRAGQRPKGMSAVNGAFWLSVGTIEPRKNQRMLVEAYRAYAKAVADPMPLVFAGGNGWLMDDFVREATAEAAPGKVVFTGRVSDDELIWLYRNCHANFYPSLFEGFGLPVLEGMQFGAATISSSSTSLPEVVGSAGLLIEPTAPEEWVNAFTSLHVDIDRRTQLRSAALERAKQFDRQAALAQLLALYDEAATSPKLRGRDAE